MQVPCQESRENDHNLSVSQLSQNSIGKDTRKHTHRKSQVLKSLKLRHNKIEAEGAVLLANELIGNYESLEFLDLGMNSIGDEGAIAVGKAFAKNHKSSLEFLDLGYHKINSKGLIVIMENLKTFKSLNLFGNRFGYDGTMALGIAFGRNHKVYIEVLDADRNMIRYKGATEFANYLLGAFKQLRLDNKNIGNEGATTIVNALAGNRFLESLHLDFCSNGNKGAMASALVENQCLECLGLCWNKIGVRGAMTLGDALTENQFLKEPDLSHNKIDNEGAFANCKCTPA